MKIAIKVSQYDQEYQLQTKIMTKIKEEIEFYNNSRSEKVIIIEVVDLDRVT